VLREVSSPLVIKLLILCRFLLSLIVLVGKFKSNSILNSSQNRFKLSFASVELNTLFHERLWSCVRNLFMLI
jgi:hypothetical protein